MKVMKAWLSIHFLLFLLAPLTLNAEPTSSTFAIEKSSAKSWTQTSASSTNYAFEIEERIEESSGDSSSLPYTLLAKSDLYSSSYVNVFFLSPTLLRNVVLQFCSLFTISPPLS
jgi:hypothetical protein